MKTTRTKIKKSENESPIDQAVEQWTNIAIQHALYNRIEKNKKLQEKPVKQK